MRFFYLALFLHLPLPDEFRFALCLDTARFLRTPALRLFPAPLVNGSLAFLHGIDIRNDGGFDCQSHRLVSGIAPERQVDHQQRYQQAMAG